MDFPEMIKALPEADIPFDGVRGWLMQGENQQAVFFDIDPIGEVKEHTHAGQFGFVLEGEMSLTIGGETKLYTKGDSYFIPAGVPHSAVFHTQVKAVDVFDESDRYKVKE